MQLHAEHIHTKQPAAVVLQAIDQQLAMQGGGHTTTVIVVGTDSEIFGASVGDSGAGQDDGSVGRGGFTAN